MVFIKKDGIVICKRLFNYGQSSYEGLVLSTPTKPLEYIRELNDDPYVNASSQDLIRLWPHRTYGKNRTDEITEPLIWSELNKREFRNEYGKWIKIYGQTYPFRDLMRFDTFVLPEEFDELNVAFNNAPFKLYAKTGRKKSNLCLPEEKERIGLGEEFDISEDTPVIYYKKKEK